MITILTGSLSSGEHTVKRKIMQFIRPILRMIDKKKPILTPKYGGHNAVTRSLVEGMKKNGEKFNYNPANEDSIFENVVLLSGIEKLERMLYLKKAGKIQFLIVGPNIVDHVLDFDNIVAHPLIDYFIVPSEWVKKLVLHDCPELKDRILIWPAGVDNKFWFPVKPVEKRKGVLIYKKTESGDFYDKIFKLLEELNFSADVIEYGNYNPAEFKKKLSNSFFAIFVSRSESEGIALVEAWSMDVPTVVYNPGDFIYGGKLVKEISACPYLNERVGKDWKTIEELRSLLLKMKQNKFSFEPRKFVLENLTDEITAKDLVDKIKFCKKVINVF